MIRLTVALTFLLAAGCQPRTAPAAPAAPTSSGTAVAQPAAPTGDATLDTFLSEIAAEVDLHDWAAVAARVAPSSVAEGLAAGIAAGLAPGDAEARLVGRALGLPTLVDGAAPRAALDRVEVVTLRTVFAMNDLPGVTNRVEGDVRLADGTTVPMGIDLGRDGSGYVLVLPSVGPRSR